MKTKRNLSRKCSAVLAAGTGVAVCLSGGGTAHGAIQTGPLRLNAFNGVTATTFVSGNQIYAFSVSAGRGRIQLNDSGGKLRAGFVGSSILMNDTVAGTYAAMHPAGVTESAGLANGFDNLNKLPTGAGSDDKYLAVYFKLNGATFHYAWIHVISCSTTTLTADTWGYEDTPDGSIKTLADSITTRRLALAGGHMKLHWSNKNEDGVSRYEVQTKDSSGEWQAIDADTPGDGRYATKVTGGTDYRLMVEKVDGTTETVDF